MENVRSLLVVGDRFSQFGALDGAVTVSRLASMLDGQAPACEIPSRLLVGQGVSESWRAYLRERAVARGLALELVDIPGQALRTGRHFAHKHRRHNILITDPSQVGVQRYHCHLVVDDECEVMSDHTTGCHLQGMLLIEAARQSFLAVTEWFLLDANQKYYFVINRLDVTYHRFAFPVGTEIDIALRNVDSSRGDRVAAEATIRFLQHGECVAEVQVAYTAILEDRLLQREAQMAQGALLQSLSAPKDGAARAMQAS
jgi:hypothetical protein